MLLGHIKVTNDKQMERVNKRKVPHQEDIKIKMVENQHTSSQPTKKQQQTQSNQTALLSAAASAASVELKYFKK